LLVQIALRSVAQLTENDRAALGELSTAVYPPEVAAAWPGLAIEWSPRQWSVIVWNDDANQALAHAGIVVRQARCNECDVKIGGIGGVMTHPAFRGQRCATAALGRCSEFFQQQGDIDFGLLVCEPTLIPFYEHLGWQRFPGEMFVTQRGQRRRFTFNLPMTRAITRQENLTGMIDLLGPPW
jgi:GNAT superfamily N-acetyltransferase